MRKKIFCTGPTRAANKNLLYWHDKPNEPTEKGPLSFVLFESPFSSVLTKGVGADTTLAWAGWKQPDIPVEVDTYRLETSRTEAGVLKKLSLAGIAKLSRLKYS